MSGKSGAAPLSGTNRFSQSWWLRPLAALVITLLLALVWSLIHQLPREPVYRGKALTLWLRAYSPSSSSTLSSPKRIEADDAVRHIGTNCLPVLLHMLREKDSKLKLRLVAFAQTQRLIKIHFVPAAQRNTEASRAFIVLGHTAKDAVPALVKLLNENISADSQGAIEDALAWIGPAAKPALPSLLRAATNSNRKLRANALWALGEIHAEPQLCVPKLIQALSDSDDWTRLSAAHALGMFGTNAQLALPSLKELTKLPRGFNSPVKSMGIQVMLEARKALKKIDPPIVPPSNEPFPEFGMPTADPPVSPR